MLQVKWTFSALSNALVFCANNGLSSANILAIENHDKAPKHTEASRPMTLFEYL